MRILRNAVAALGVFLMSLAAISPAFSLTSPATFAPRNFQTQQTHYIRFTVSANSCVYASLTCSVKVGNLPYNAFVVRIYSQNVVTFSGGSVSAMTASIGTGTAGPYVNLMAAVNILTAGNAVAQTVAAGGLGETVTGNGAAQNGQDGGFDLYATLTATTGAPTAGSAVFIVEYIAPNDGACIAYPLQGATGAC
jgi:hypothetical protein